MRRIGSRARRARLEAPGSGPVEFTIAAGVGGRLRIDRVPDLAIQVAPRLDPSFAGAPSLPAVEDVRAILADELGLPEVRHQATGDTGPKAAWLSTSESTFGLWPAPGAHPLEDAARDRWLRELELLDGNDHAQVITRETLRIGLAVPFTTMLATANAELDARDDRLALGDDVLARIDRVDLRRGGDQELDTTLHGVLLREGLRRNYRFFITVRDRFEIRRVAIGTHQVGTVAVTGRVVDAGIDGVRGELLRLFQDALLLSDGGLIAHAIVKLVMTVCGVHYPGLVAEGEDYLALAIRLGLVDGDRFAGLGAAIATTLPRQLLVPPEPNVHREPVIEPRLEKLLVDLTDVSVTPTAVHVRGNAFTVDREPAVRIVGTGFLYDPATRTVRGDVRAEPFDLEPPFTVAWEVASGTADAPTALATSISAPVAAAFLPISVTLTLTDAADITRTTSASFSAPTSASPSPTAPSDPQP